jgi:hypothetical protein
MKIYSTLIATIATAFALSSSAMASTQNLFLKNLREKVNELAASPDRHKMLPGELEAINAMSNAAYEKCFLANANKTMTDQEKRACVDATKAFKDSFTQLEEKIKRRKQDFNAWAQEQNEHRAMNLTPQQIANQVRQGEQKQQRTQPGSRPGGVQSAPMTISVKDKARAPNAGRSGTGQGRNH